jgi:hypothetical protein
MIIGLIGFARSGKSTAAEHLQKNYGFERVNFKDGLIAEIKQNFPDLLYQICVACDKLEGGSWVEEDLFSIKPPIMRALLQNYGTEVRRGDNPNYWVEKWEDGIMTSGVENVVTDDVRFLNEAEAVKDFQGVLVRIVRSDITQAGTHASETEHLQMQEDFRIEVGPGEHQKLYEELDRIISQLKVNGR